MEHAHTALLSHIAPWPAAAQSVLWDLRALFHDVAKQAEVGPLDETLKWGQPAWRPVSPRTGSTLRVSWNAETPDRLSLFVDCKTDLAARMRDIYPDLPFNDGRRQMGIDLASALPLQAMTHLAEMTFCYHRARRRAGD